MIWDWLVQRTGKYCSIRRIEYPEFQTGIFGRMESALCSNCRRNLKDKFPKASLLKREKKSKKQDPAPLSPSRVKWWAPNWEPI